MHHIRTRLLFMSLLVVLLITGCGESSKKPKESKVDTIIAKAQEMTLQELATMAISESNGKNFFGLGNTSRGKDALPKFIKYLQTIDPSYNMSFSWQQPKNNKIYDQLIADAAKETGTFAMTLIQDGAQFKPKMLDTGFLKRFIPTEWAEANKIKIDEYKGYLPLLMISKIFEYNCCGNMTYKNCWDFVGLDEKGKKVRPLFMYAATETVGMNFLYMLTTDKYSKILKDAFDCLSEDKKLYFKPVIDEVAGTAQSFRLGENGKYALAWIKLWMENYNGQTDDGPICNILISSTAKDQCGLLVYSKLRSVVESANVSLNNIKVAAYDPEYKGISGFGYSHYLFVTDNSPLPWTACAFISFMVSQQEGFEAWGKDIGCYSTNPDIDKQNEEIHHHLRGGYDENGNLRFEVKNDRGYDWWRNEGNLVMEDPEYCSKVAFTIGRWVDSLDD